jgi:hypothetical protein
MDMAALRDGRRGNERPPISSSCTDRGTLVQELTIEAALER